MKKRIVQATTLLFMGVVLLGACKKKEEPQPGGDNNPIVGGKGTLKVELNHVVNGAPLQLNSSWYINENGDSFQVTKMSYYLSNFKFHGDGNPDYSAPETYFLVQEEDPSSLKFEIKEIPEGSYHAISFLIGVDSLRNVSGAQTGALDPVHGMFWDWNTGYIMAKFEGNAPASPSNGKLLYHVGGFSGEHNTLQRVTLNLPNTMKLIDNSAQLKIEADLGEWFKNPHTIDFSELHTIHMPNANAKKLSENYRSMFEISGFSD